MSRRWLASLAALLLVACAAAERSGFLPRTIGAESTHRGFFIRDAARAAVIIWNNGWLESGAHHLCDPLSDDALAGPPAAVKTLSRSSAEEPRVLLYVVCTDYALDWSSLAAWREEETRVAERLEALVAQFVAAGVRPERIVLAGQSLGGWMGLVVAARRRVEVGGVLAFAPGFAPAHATRPAAWWGFMAKRGSAIASRLDVPALVYAYPDDPWDLPQHLAFLARFPGVEFVSLDLRGRCALTMGVHLTAYAPCFEAAERVRLAAFLARVFAQRASTSGPSSQ